MTISYGKNQRNEITVSQRLHAEIPVSDTINLIFDGSDDAVFGVDSRGEVKYFNQRCADFFGVNQALNNPTKYCSDFLCGEDKKCGEDCCEQCAIKANIKFEKQINDYRLHIKKCDGESVLMNIGTCYFYQEDKNKASTYFSLREVTD